MTKSIKTALQQEWKNGHAGIDAAALVVAKTQGEWERLWHDMHRNQSSPPAAPRLPKGKMAIGIFTGTNSRPSDLSVTKVEAKDDTTTISWKQEMRPSGGLGLTVMHSPGLLKWVDLTNDAVFQKEPPPNAVSISLLRQPLQDME